MTRDDRPRRCGGLPATLAWLGLLLGATAAIVEVFQVGVLTAAALAGVGIVACAAPASLLGLPVPGVGGLLDPLAGLVSGAISAVLSLLRAPFD